MSRPCHDMSSRRRVRRGAALACVFAGVLATGAATGSWPEAADGTELTAGGDAGQVVSRSGDPWAAAYSAEEYEEVAQRLDGEYVGTGIAVIRTADGRIEVSEVHAGSPAERAGIRPGDEIRTIDGTGLDGRPVTDAVERLRGSDQAEQAGPGSTVLLGLERDGRAWETDVERARLSVEPVTVDRDVPGVTRIHVSAFTRGSAEALRSAVEALPEGDRILLDLRGNAGGLLTEAADAASVFLDGGLVATYDVYGTEHALHAERGGDTATPLVVLVDGGTMSSAELLTGALQERNRAVIVGSRTFGKGTVQMPSEQPDGSVAELTVGHYATPSGRTVDDGGIVPDLVVDAGEDAEAEARTVLDGLAAGR
ncbi:S41 family peptidase [Streptomyces litchfieldiae]|uniref:S41 family peptidase n=1 Tax=Streptomyces litchfieldiae TaxID=3075543 RepID=A0ABU2MPL4_9ACTN|nr:S41 family peptidase [Streptomyces sp. DSM 44938]MDT0343019.1 S41 family peptidase [Streptomyces sp. DSM 44938]